MVDVSAPSLPFARGGARGAPLLATKLDVPRARAGLVPRRRLAERLTAGLRAELILLCAPAGFGKTTLLSHGARDTGWPLLWVSLDAADNDPARFWAYLIAALGALRPGLGEDALLLLRAPQPPPLEVALTVLLNEVGGLRDDFVLALDDYHLIEEPTIHRGVAFLLEQLPARMHLAISTRADPPLPLARLRARGQLAEIRAADLRFAGDEAAAFLRGALGRALPAEAVATLAERTEGWIAGLQLAALSLRGRDDVPAAIAAFAGSQRYILDYLTEEVLRRQPAPVQRFLLETSILDRLSGPLCAAVAGQPDAQATLEALERDNLFVAPLDEEGRWYRYHRLFADVLRAQLARSHPERIAALHRRAATWYEAAGWAEEALAHALASGDAERAACLVERQAEALVARSEGATLGRWLATLPDELLRARPRLAIVAAVAALVGGRVDAVAPLLADAERATAARRGQAAADDELAGADWLADIGGTIAVIRGTLARLRGDVPGAIAQASRALAELPAERRFLRAIAGWDLGLASWTGGDLATAARVLGDVGVPGADDGLSTTVHVRLLALYGLGRVRTAQGRLHEAAAVYRRALRTTTGEGRAILPAACAAYIGLGDLALAWNDLGAATRYLEEGIGLAERTANAALLADGWTALARVRQALGDTDGARVALARVIAATPDALADQPGGPTQAWLQLAQGDAESAWRWARGRGLTADDEPSYPREGEHLILARALSARNRPGEALPLLGRLLDAADAGGRTRSVIEILVLMALAHQAAGDGPRALDSLARALTLAEPEGFARVFLDEAPSLTPLLRQAIARGAAPSFGRRLLDALEGVAPFPVPDRPLASPLLVEPLTERELAVLRLLATGLAAPAIARELFVAVSTVRSHTKSLYGKLDVHSRDQAVARSRELGLLP